MPSQQAIVIFVHSPNSLPWGSLLEQKGWPRYALAAFLELVRHVSTLCPPRRHVSFALAVPPNFVRFPPRLVRLVFIRLGSALAAPPSVVSPILPSVSAMCPLLVSSLSSHCPLVVRSLSALCRFLAGSMVWLWLGLCQLCARSLVFAPWSVLCPLLSALVEVFVATPLPAVRLVTFSR